MNSNDKLVGLLKRRFAEGEEQTERFEDMCGIVDGYEPEDVAMLACMVGFIETVVTVEGHQSKLAGGYTEQPTNECDRVLTLTYGYLGSNGKMEDNKWIARIYFTDSGPRMGLPKECLKPDSEEKVDIGKDAFSPQDRYIEDFFKCSGNYLDWNKLKAR